MPTRLIVWATSVRRNRIPKIQHVDRSLCALTLDNFPIPTIVRSIKFAPALVVSHKERPVLADRFTNQVRRDVVFVLSQVAANDLTALIVNLDYPFFVPILLFMLFALRLITCHIPWFLNVQMRSVKSTIRI